MKIARSTCNNPRKDERSSEHVQHVRTYGLDHREESGSKDSPYSEVRSLKTASLRGGGLMSARSNIERCSTFANTVQHLARNFWSDSASKDRRVREQELRASCVARERRSSTARCEKSDHQLRPLRVKRVFVSFEHRKVQRAADMNNTRRRLKACRAPFIAR